MLELFSGNGHYVLLRVKREKKKEYLKCTPLCLQHCGNITHECRFTQKAQPLTSWQLATCEKDRSGLQSDSKI